MADPNPLQSLEICTKWEKWPEDRPKEDVYKLLIDAYRLRINDDLKFRNIQHADPIYEDAPNEDTIHAETSFGGTPNLFLFLQMADLVGLMPTWWDASETASCIDRAKYLTWSNIATQVTADDVKEYDGDNSMVLRLRIFADQVIDMPPMGFDLMKLLDVEVMLEKSHEFLNYIHQPMDSDTEVEASDEDDGNPEVALG
ncbi:hypothetical protein N7509_009631 [Penicillium cosmopolitanum]|uniref:Uncharacterized protein n=1 Tax=Penicillium cosmopolitanum TaxID=1131564 RepID=A0A9W9VPY0_9EURO|nr:uncharacterized protein N7509_009631 [Penicillium cosmopolitanum]KAJ5387090.1 hypothetical protein N7509_009631 [Penicillium cosmopolitanum]